MNFLKRIKSPLLRTVAEYGIITVSIELMVIGIYFFKFPNKFSFGGISGLASAIGALTGISSSLFTNIVNVVLLLLGFLILGKEVGIRTAYSTVVMTVSLQLLEQLVPMNAPLTSEPLLELVFAIILPGIASAILFEVNASSGGTDIIAMIMRKYTSMNIATALFFADVLAVGLSFWVFGIETGLLSVLGLCMKSLIIDAMLESMNLVKCFNIVCDDPEPICRYIIEELNHSATVYQAVGAYSHRPKSIVMTMMSRSQALRLRQYIRQSQPGVFVQITNSSEIFGKGFASV